MKKIKKNNLNVLLLIAFIAIAFSSCERDLSDESTIATFQTNGDVFLNSFSGGLEYYPFADSKFTAFTVDNQTVYEGSASMRIDVPNVGDNEGAYAGAIFRDDNGGRDLSGFDVLTFWAKATKSSIINDIGFGQDFGENKYQVSLQNLQISTGWQQYFIPIPDPSKLTQERGMFWYAEGPEGNQVIVNGDTFTTNAVGYTFWVDELRFEKLGTVAQPRPRILSGADLLQETFIGSTITLNGLTQTFNLSTGDDITVAAAPGYFNFSSSNSSVATVSEQGVVNVVGAGNAVITANINGVDAAGSLTLESLGPFVPAPNPTQASNNVISIFSDAYTNVPVDFYNGYYAPFQTTQGQDDIEINGDNIIKYTDLNFVGIEFKNPTINADAMKFLHIDIRVENTINPGDFISVEVADFGADRAFGGGDDSSGRIRFNGSTFSTGNWVSLDIPLSDFALTSTSNLGQMLFITDGTNPTIPGSITDILVDNIYLYKTLGPTIPFNFDNDQIDYNFGTFNGASFSVVDNPQQSGINATNTKVGAMTNSGLAWEGGAIDLENPVNFGNGNKIKFKLYSTAAVPVLLKFENGANGAGDIEVSANHTGSGWEELEFTFASTNQYSKFVLFIDGPGTTSGTFYIDDVIQSN